MLNHFSFVSLFQRPEKVCGRKLRENRFSQSPFARGTTTKKGGKDVPLYFQYALLFCQTFQPYKKRVLQDGTPFFSQLSKRCLRQRITDQKTRFSNSKQKQTQVFKVLFLNSEEYR